MTPGPWLRTLCALLATAAVGCTPYPIYWGDVHGHTMQSDGHGTVAGYLSHARDVADLDFVVVTDHDFGHAAPWRMPREVWTRTQDAVDAATVDGEFVAIAGYEWTSQPRYWRDYEGDTPSEGLFQGPPRHYNHKIVYSPRRIPYLFSAKDPRYMTPALLAGEVRKAGGLVHNAHPDAGPGGSDQWDYSLASARVSTNSEIGPDILWYEGKRHETNMEAAVRSYLDRGGRTGFVSGTDTHEGKPAARTAVLARELTRDAIFEALRHRRCYAISHARIILDFRIDGHRMGEVAETQGKPLIFLDVRGTDRIAEVVIVRNGAALHSYRPDSDHVRLELVDASFEEDSYYYVRVTQVDTDRQGNPSRAWSSPIWLTRKRGET